MAKRDSSLGKTTAKVAKCLCNLAGNHPLWVILIHILHLGLIAKLPAVGFMAAMYLQRAVLFFVEVDKDSLCVVDILQGEFAPAIPVAVIQVLPDDRVGASRAIGVDLDARGGP